MLYDKNGQPIQQNPPHVFGKWRVSPEDKIGFKPLESHGSNPRKDSDFLRGLTSPSVLRKND